MTHNVDQQASQAIGWNGKADSYEDLLVQGVALVGKGFPEAF